MKIIFLFDFITSFLNDQGRWGKWESLQFPVNELPLFLPSSWSTSSMASSTVFPFFTGLLLARREESTLSEFMLPPTMDSRGKFIMILGCIKRSTKRKKKGDVNSVEQVQLVCNNRVIISSNPISKSFLHSIYIYIVFFNTFYYKIVVIIIFLFEFSEKPCIIYFYHIKINNKKKT